MFTDNENNRKQLTKWILEVAAACILLYLGIRHIDAIAAGMKWLAKLLSPVLAGCILAAIINLPLKMAEERFLNKTKLKKAKRPLAILFSLFLIIGIFLIVILLVIPELGNALSVLGEMTMDSIDRLEELDLDSSFLNGTAAGKFLDNAVDWESVKDSLEQGVQTAGKALMDTTLSAVGTAVSSLVNFFMGLVFAIYILAQKEKLASQFRYLIRIWLPEKAGSRLLHVLSVCGKCFSNFIAGQTTEALILGILCTFGMLLLGLPYAPMIGALIGVTALLPVVGAYIGGTVGVLMILTESPVKALIFVVFLVILQQLEGNLIYPRVVGSKINLPGIWVLAAICIGGNLCGAFGMLLGVPIFSAAYTLFKEATQERAKRAASVSNSVSASDPASEQSNTPPQEAGHQI